ncbi:DUF3800 domain-containing protein [Ensifer sp. ENS07]|uniref:DUF3800 domain-containing protein n=1 Tax=Ensifer sp. ENS07 TaxID=2769274 RepID=UPI00177F8795|nr:DUF3800 domain-containing protein [Ensifer sp. ENS07]MBD9635498.1 DUF3800 domain-containing protein [Ensifer sp. ENS07]
MIFAYLDEFGHAGPYFGRSHLRHNASPVFGLAGILLPETAVRPFATVFLKRKKELLDVEIQRSNKNGYEWEKKGTNLFTANSISKYPAVRNAMLRLINEVRNSQGKIFYYGREKIRGTEDVRANGLYTTVFANAIRQINSYCESIGENFVLIVDEHSARKELLETAAKTMFGAEPVRRLLSPPFEVESYLNQNMQAADWIATIVGRLWNHRLDPLDFAAYSDYEKYYWRRVHSVATHSSVMQRPRNKAQSASHGSEPHVGSLGLKLKAALSLKTTTIIEEVTTIAVDHCD